MRTVICDLLGVEFPIVAFSHCRDVVAAVTKAGGFGVLGATKKRPDDLETDLRILDEELGPRSYGIDLLMPTIEAVDLPEIPEAHRRFLDDILERYAIPPLPEGHPGPHLSARLGVAGAMTLAEIALAHPLKLVATGLGAPPPELTSAVRELDAVMAALVGTKAQAVRQQTAGVDIVIAQGSEAGGHTGEIGTMVLVPEVVDAVDPLPVLAAGGIATGRQMAAAMALGAKGVWTGSVWTTTQEAETHPAVKEKFLTATSSDTVRDRNYSGKPCRQLRTAWTKEWTSAASPGNLPMPLHPLLIEEAFIRIDHAASNGNQGAKELIIHPVGQVVGRLNTVKPCSRVIYEMVEEYIDVASRFSKELVP